MTQKLWVLPCNSVDASLIRDESQPSIFLLPPSSVAAWRCVKRLRRSGSAGGLCRPLPGALPLAPNKRMITSTSSPVGRTLQDAGKV